MTEETNEKKSRFKFSLSKANRIGLALGLIGGYLYYRFVGCVSGTCPITSNPWISMLWGAMIGYLASDMFTPKTQEK